MWVIRTADFFALGLGKKKNREFAHWLNDKVFMTNFWFSAERRRR